MSIKSAPPPATAGVSVKSRGEPKFDLIRATLTFLRSDHAGPIGLAVCCILISLISIHDAMLVIVNYEVINEMEQNPIGVWLLGLQGGQVWLFVLVKLACTALVCTVLVSLYQYRRRIAMTVASSLAGFQSLLLGYLTIG
ncbi:hypothetical protein FYK55_07165 [Roseiconus nitratireducens]|uniref:DUF5658 domain-containing protein n=1 Tax=Roseiconus nitratireducens TaxID=2605748 RepID=A0A5M6DDE7_9BACT|nr:hypothetical protein [Roseiconus nitratireducens]KAA5545423.1 hypothetical protein FYK55_07165 [Roseiconus nitratireducens]